MKLSFGMPLGLAVCLALSACAGRGRLITRKGVKPVSAGVLASLTSPGPVSATAQAPDLTVKAQPGDSLWRISRRTLTRGALWPRLAEANKVADPWIIQPGQVLRVPGTQGTAVAVSPAAKKRPLQESKRYGWKAKPNNAFTTGEKLTFAVQYGAVTAGYATLAIPEVVEAEGRPVFHIVAEAKTHPFFETFFKVQDRIESFIDVDNTFSWRYEKHLHEGGYKADAAYVFDQRAGFIREQAKGKDNAMPVGSQDVLSCFYYTRTLPLKVGDEVTMMVSADDMKSYELKVNVLRKEKASTLAGDFDCVVVQPHLKFQGVFQQKGEVFIWLTDDARHIPVMIRSKIVIGSININLQDAEWVEPAGN